jgi:phosphoenolpyruvate carboxykinase (ATP)
VALSEDQKSIDFFDGSITENGRSSYPLNFIKDRVISGEGKIPKHIFFLTADAFGVLPAISKLNQKEAKKFFVLGYTAKLAGTEIGIKTPKAAFSPCFGAPFMLLHPSVYANLLSQYMDKYGMNVWLINTGWSGGGYGEGSRFPLKITRELIRAVSNGELENAVFIKDEIFNLEVPTKIRNITEETLIPSRSWKNQTKYNEEAIKLRDKFDSEIKKFKLD